MPVFHKIVINILINSLISLAFVLLNYWALYNNLEETFTSLALFYGFIVIVVNALFIRFYSTQ